MDALQIRPAVCDGHKLCALKNTIKLLDAQDGSGSVRSQEEMKCGCMLIFVCWGMRKLAQKRRKLMGITQSQCVVLETDPWDPSKPLPSSDCHLRVCRRKEISSDLQVPSNGPHCISTC